MADDRLTEIAARVAVSTDPGACGTCRSRVRDGLPVERDECAARATLLEAPGQPYYEDLVDLTTEEKAALPARFHTPTFDRLGKPNAWLCRVCWGDGWVTQWPCATAQKHGAEVFTADHIAQGEQRKRAAQLEQARSVAVELENENARLRAAQQTLVGRARRVADAYRWSIEDSSDPGTEALCAQYELVNHLATLPGGDGLPVNTVEQALRIVLDLLDKYDENVTPREIRAAIAKALPHNWVDKRRRIYLDGTGHAWLDQSVTSDGTRWIAPLAGSMPSGAETETSVADRTGGLREIGRTW